jgi:hypothetical protein
MVEEMCNEQFAQYLGDGFKHPSDMSAEELSEFQATYTRYIVDDLRNAAQRYMGFIYDNKKGIVIGGGVIYATDNAFDVRYMTDYEKIEWSFKLLDKGVK